MAKTTLLGPDVEPAKPADPKKRRTNADSALSGAAQGQGAAAVANVGKKNGSELFRE